MDKTTEKDCFVIDNIFIDKYAKKCGLSGCLVYMTLCRVASSLIDYSINEISRISGLSKSSVVTGIKKLKKFNIIFVEKTNGNNIYFLTNYKDWE